jgi:uncharacterized protein
MRFNADPCKEEGWSMIGTIINVATIIVGGTLGCLLGSRLPDNLRKTVIAGMGLFLLAYGVQMYLKTGNMLIVVGSILIGAFLGEWWKIEDWLVSLGEWLEKRFSQNKNGESDGRFVRGFLTASILFCTGPMAILGSIQDGLTGNYQTLVVKAVLDGITAMAFASSLGVGVIFSALMILIYQGSITLLAAQAQAIFTTSMINEMCAAGGVILMAISISSMLEIKKIRTGNFLPALVIAPLIAWLVTVLKF